MFVMSGSSRVHYREVQVYILLFLCNCPTYSIIVDNMFTILCFTDKSSYANGSFSAVLVSYPWSCKSC